VPVKIAGLPAHVLLIHAVVVLLPLAALMLVASALWPAARAKLGFLTPAIALVALILVPLTTHAGEWLKDQLGFSTPAIRKHAELGDTLLPWAIGIFVVSAAVWVLGRRYGLAWRPAAETRADVGDEASSAGGTATLARPRAATQALPVWVTAGLAVAAVAVAVGGLIQLYRIGDSGAQAVWGDTLKGK
jgi:hypothetical protein